MASLLTGAILSLQILILLIGRSVSLTSTVVGLIFSRDRVCDYFKLSLQWPGTVCRGTRHCCSSIACCGGSKSPTEFTIQKHGTCSSPVVKDEYDYFLTTLNVYFKYNVTEVLNEAGYVPSNSEKYPLGGIVSAIQNAFHATPELSCSKGAVEELRLCFYKDFKPIDCVTGPSSSQSDMISSKKSCPKYVSLPEHVSLGLRNGETPGSGLPRNEAF